MVISLKNTGHLKGDLENLLGFRSDNNKPQDESEHVIPIKKITDFSQIPPEEKPMNIDPVAEIKKEEPVKEVEEKKDYTAPEELLSYIDQLIKNGAKLNWFRSYDITSVTSPEDARNVIEYEFNTGKITEDQKNKMLEIVGISGSENVASSTENKTEPEENNIPSDSDSIKEVLEEDAPEEPASIKQAEEEDPFDKTINISVADVEKMEEKIIEDLGSKLEVARKEYIENLAEHMRKIRAGKEKYLELMMNLGIDDKQMPLPRISGGLEVSRRTYEDLLKRKLEKLSGNGRIVDAVGIIESDYEKIMDEVVLVLTERERKIREKGLVVFDRGDIGQISEALLSGDRAKLLSNLRVTSRVPTYGGLRTTSGTENSQEAKYDNFVNKDSEEEFIESVGEEAVQEDKIVFRVDFKGNEVELIREKIGENQDILKIVFGGEEVARGEITERGPILELNKKFKHSWWQAKTIQEEAIEHVSGMLATIKK
jgi:hypothetical protein